ncbi:MAG: hypothetical protein N2255_00665 [Kiritimatiellae bacterium]|nr:hypothetical protein [Kiritimatiellia bacterium]
MILPRWGLRRVDLFFPGAIVFLVILSPALGGELIREIEIRSEPEANGHKDFTVRLLPGQTYECERVQFECVYHQEFPWEDVRGRKYTKIYEPVNFKYQRKDVKFVNDLDTYISFRVPIGRDLLENAYGETAFAKGYPVTISRIRITAFAEGKPLWSYEVPAGGKHLTANLQTSLPPAPPQQTGEQKNDLEETTEPKVPSKLP